MNVSAPGADGHHHLARTFAKNRRPISERGDDRSAGTLSAMRMPPELRVAQSMHDHDDFGTTMSVSFRCGNPINRSRL